MTISVSRGTFHDSRGQKLCGKCGLRPRRPGQRTCGPCHSEYMRQWREGKIEMLLTAEERELILCLRAGRSVQNMANPVAG